MDFEFGHVKDGNTAIIKSEGKRLSVLMVSFIALILSLRTFEPVNRGFAANVMLNMRLTV